jgi:hypothetical protein
MALPSSTVPHPPPATSTNNSNNAGGSANNNNHEHSKPSKRNSRQRNNNNNNGNDKNNMMPAMQLGGYPGMYPYNMDPSALYGYPNMMMPHQQGNMNAPPHTDGAIPGSGGSANVSSNLVDEGLAGTNGNASPVSSQHPYGGMGMQGYMPGFTAPPQNPYFYGGGYPGGWPAFPAQFPGQNYGQQGNPQMNNNGGYGQQGQQGNVGNNLGGYPNMDPSGYGYTPNMNMDGTYFPPQGGGGGKSGKGGNSGNKSGDKNNEPYRNSSDGTQSRGGRNRGNGGDNNSPSNGASGNNKSWGGYQGQANNADQNMMWQQQQAFHMMQGNPNYGAQGGGQGGNPPGQGAQYPNYYAPPPQQGQNSGGQGNWRS